MKKLIGVAVVGVGMVGALCLAETPWDKDPNSSPLWWTLTERVTPVQLQEAHRDKGQAIARYEASVAKGRAMPFRSDTDRQRLTGFVDGALFPELIPLASAIETVMPELSSGPSSLRASLFRLKLEEYGLSPKGIDDIFSFAMGFNSEVESYEAEVGQHLVRVADLIRDAEAQSGHPRKDLWAAFERSDARVLAAATGADVSELETSLRYNYNPSLRYLRRELPGLRSKLLGPDWSRFRTYLFREVAPGTTIYGWEDE